jgi:hypothetical protein
MPEKSELDTFVDVSKEAIKTAQTLGYFSTEQIRGDLFDVLNVVAEGAFKAEESEDVVALREKLHSIRNLSERVHLPFFGVGVNTEEDGSVSFIFAD